jgi:hypothetical protein
MSVTIHTSESRSAALSSRHCRAICGEVGERLAVFLRPTTELPPRLADLLARLALLDHDAPSIVPSVEDMISPKAAMTALV